MTTAAVVMLVLRVSLALTVLAVSLNARLSDATYLVRHPSLLLRSLTAMNLVMPVVALAFSSIFSLNAPVKLALITLSVSPIPPFLPGKALKSGGDNAYTVALLTTMSVLALVIIPVTMALLGALFGLAVTVRPATVANVVGDGILLPVAVGMGLRRLAPVLANKLLKPVNIIAKLMLVGGLIPLLIVTWPAMHAVVDNGTLFAIVAITVIGIGVGHTLGGPAPEDRPVLALATACRHPAVAMAIASTVFPTEKAIVGAAILADVLVAAIVTAPYVRMSSRALRGGAHPTRRPSDAPTPSHHRA
jgi:BASS family bile acid:Na+ symporter